MADSSEDTDMPEIPSCLLDSPDTEVSLHQEFILRHVDFLIDVLTGEQYHQKWLHPAGCPTATPETQCRKRKSDQQFPCRYESLTESTPETTCTCEDALTGSDDPLDTVAAVAIAPDDQPPSQRYFNREYRQIIADLRDQIGSWDDIATLDKDELEAALLEATNRPSISDTRITRLQKLVGAVSDDDHTDGVSLRGLGGLQYSSFANLLAEFPGISNSDAWWLMLVAFDKPVWPSDPFVDGLLCSLGLLSTDELRDDVERREGLEEKLARRQIPQLHRAVAGHAVKGGIDACDDDCELQKFLLTHRLRRQKQENPGPVVVDLFSGAGGLSLGFVRNNWTIELAIDNDRHAIDTYRLNHPEIPHEKIVCGDIRTELEEGLLERIDQKPDVIAGGPPCQSLSQAGYRARLSDDSEYNILEDERTELYKEYVTAVERLRPKALVMENVEGMANEIGNTGVRVADLVVDALNSIGVDGHGYTCDYRLLDCADYGIPQYRERIFIFGVRDDLVGENDEDIVEALFEQVSEVGPTDEVTLKQALSGLPKLRRGEGGRVVPDSVRGTRSEYVEDHELGTGTEFCYNHQAREHPMEKDQTLFDEALEPGDTGWDVKYGKDGEYADLIEYDVGTEENPRFKDKYRMLEWTEPAPTVVAHLAKDANNFVLPDYYEHAPNVSGEPDNRRNRGITPREAARLQSFPDDYVFLGPFTHWFRQIGNAVPPLMGERIADVLQQQLNSEPATVFSCRSPQQASTDD